MTEPTTSDAPSPAESRFRRTLTQVLIVQVVALALLGLIQLVYGG